MACPSKRDTAASLALPSKRQPPAVSSSDADDGRSDRQSNAAPALSLKNIVKSFPGVRALRGVSLEVFPGEVHALLGENGAGKSTLIKILSGVHSPDEGEMRIRGEVVH